MTYVSPDDDPFLRNLRLEKNNATFEWLLDTVYTSEPVKVTARYHKINGNFVRFEYKDAHDETHFFTWDRNDPDNLSVKTVTTANEVVQLELRKLLPQPPPARAQARQAPPAPQPLPQPHIDFMAYTYDPHCPTLGVTHRHTKKTFEVTMASELIITTPNLDDYY